MAFGLKAWLAPPVREKTAQKWSVLSESLRNGGRPPARSLREEAVKLYREIGTFLQLSDPRAIRVRQGLGRVVSRPGTDWAWRPGIMCGPVVPAGIAAPGAGQKLADEIAVWHDCEHRALILRQLQNRDAGDNAPFGLRLEVMAFTGSYLSLSLDLPADILDGLGKNHVIQLETAFQTEIPLTVYGRLNLVQGPNTEQVLRELRVLDGATSDYSIGEYDLAYADLSDRPVEKVWLDLIFTSPYMNAVTIRDIALARYPRAET